MHTPPGQPGSGVLQRERLLTLAQAARRVPGRSGRPLHVSTLHRWAVRGVRGVRLETSLIGGQRYTSLESMERFESRLNGKSSCEPECLTEHRSLAQVDRTLDELGL